jgi:hypothetical protein
MELSYHTTTPNKNKKEISLEILFKKRLRKCRIAWRVVPLRIPHSLEKKQRTEMSAGPYARPCTNNKL